MSAVDKKKSSAVDMNYNGVDIHFRYISCACLKSQIQDFELVIISLELDVSKWDYSQVCTSCRDV